jgi:glycosyltransferase involved in cell wall biosynthesis
VLNPFFYPYSGGTEKVLLEVYKRMARKHNVTVISAVLNPRSKGKTEEIQGIKVVRLPAEYLNLPRFPMPYVIMKGLNRAIKDTHADIYHINNRFQFMSNNVRAARSVGGKIAITLHNATPKNINLLTDSAGLVYDFASGRRLIAECDLITGISKNTIDTTVPRKLIPNTHVVYNGVDFKRFRPRKKNARMRSILQELGIEGKIIMNNGRLIPQKGQEYLLRAFAHFNSNNYADSSLLIIGRGYLAGYLNSLSRKLGISDRFRIVTGISEADLPLYYNLSSTFVMPSVYEPASVALLEGMSSSIPTIASRVGGMPEMMKDGGFYFKPKSTKALYKQLCYVFSGDRNIKERARRSRKIIIKEHNWDIIAKTYSRLFEETIKQ